MRGNKKRNNGNGKSNSKGVALVTALMLLTIITAIIGSASAISIYMSREVSTSLRNARTFYLAESAMNHAVFYLKQDVSAHADRTLGKVDYTNTMAEPRYMADGVPRTMTLFGTEISYSISDAAGSFSITPANTLPERLKEFRQRRNHGKIVALEDEWNFTRSMNLFQDFVDSDDRRGADSMERPEYQKTGLPMLPRNQAPEFVNELLWIPGFRRFLKPDENGLVTDFTVIAPSGLATIAEVKKLYSSPLPILADAAELTDSEQEKLGKALMLWRTKQIAIRKSLDIALIKKIFDEESGIEETESGIYRIKIGGKESGFFMTAVLSLNQGSAYLEYYEYLFF